MPPLSNDSPLTLAMTGASGLPYALRLLQCLVLAGRKVYVVVSEATREVARVEMGLELPTQPRELHAQWSEALSIDPAGFQVLATHDWLSAPASGSGAPAQMVICPCSMGTLAAIAHGASDNLIERAADVVIKERGQLIVVPREMPYSTLHLQNMLALSQLGVTIMPASPAFYHRPHSLDEMIDFVVARILDHLRVPQALVSTWGTASA